MFRSKVLLILGAGSSKEVKLPTGEELIGMIVKKLRYEYDDDYPKEPSNLGERDRDVYSAIKNNFHKDITRYLRAANALSLALPNSISIDNALHAHHEDKYIEVCGKLAIANCILQKEEESTINPRSFKEEKIDYLALGETWFSGFFKILTENTTRSEVGKLFKNVAIINFNYDRCITLYLYEALSAYYQIEKTQVAGLMKDLKIIHPYGCVGDLPWQNIGRGVTPYGGGNNTNLLDIIPKIKTFSESREDEQELMDIRNCVREAEIIVFLGFRFHRQNLELLNPGKVCSARKVYATALGMSQSDCSDVSASIYSILGGLKSNASIELRNDLKCGQLFREYWRSLSSGN